MAGMSRMRKRQTRLGFTPLPSSSPAAKGYPKQIQDRAAAVTLSGRRTPRIEHTDASNDSIPTPATSDQKIRSQAIGESDSENDSEPIRSTQRQQSTQHLAKRRRIASRQQQIDFSNARDPDSFSSPIKLSSPFRPQSSARAGMFGAQSRKLDFDVSSDGDSDDELPSPRELVMQSKPAAAESGESKRLRRTRSQQQPVTIDSDDNDNIVLGNNESSAIRVESEDDDGDNIVVGNGKSNAIHVESEEDDDDDMPTTAGVQRRRRTKHASPDSFIASSPPQMMDSDDDLEIIEPPPKRRRRHESDEDEPSTPNRRRLKPKRKLSEREQNELNEELDFLGPSSDVELSARKARSTLDAKKNARLEALNKLKRRRSGRMEEPQQEPRDSRGAAEEHAQSDELNDSNENDDTDDYHDDYQPRVRSSQMFQEDENDAGFIDSEGEGDNDLGVPSDLPLEFTRYASMKPKELFKYAVEWFVQKKINPAFRMEDPIYRLTFHKLDDEVTGLAASKFKSSAWTPQFTMSLNSRPSIAFEPIDRTEAEHWMRDTCDACNRTNHPATFQIQFQGQPYYPETLEEVAANDDDDDDDSSSQSQDRAGEPSYDASGRQVPPENKIYYVGKFCMSNAQTAHALQHWRYHLNEWVITWLTRNGYSTPEEVVKRDGWSTKKRRKYANKVADRLERDGIVKQLYRDYRKNIDEARDSKQGRYSSGWN